MVNPNPGLITDEMWRLWEERPNPNWRLGGIYANKKGYHNSVNANLAHWPDNYSVKLPLDLVAENRRYARAIDLTMSDEEMVLWTNRMKKAFENPVDPRLDAVKEFYGTLDSKTVFGLSKDSINGKWRRVSADSTHLWHGHTSIFTAFVKNWRMLSPLLSVWRGESFEQWSASDMNLPILGDSGQGVKYWQYIHQIVRKTVNPESPSIKIDGDYGDATAAAFVDFYRKTGGTDPTYNGSYLSAWTAIKYITAFNRVTNPMTGIPAHEHAPVSKEQILEAVQEYMSTNLGNVFKVSGTIEGTLTRDERKTN